MEFNLDQLDNNTLAIYLQVPQSKVVLLQAYFELYEGLGVVRTLNIRKSLVCVLTTSSVVEECKKALESIKDSLEWREVEKPEEAERELYVGYYSARVNPKS